MYVFGLRDVMTCMDTTRHDQVGTTPIEASRPARPLFLTPRERQVVQFLVDGCSNDDIATRLRLRPQTVKNQLTRIYTKAGVSSRVQLAVAAIRQGLAEPH
jgi:two-component system, NarL family, nitrate/nitrite response regulator NarL